MPNERSLLIFSGIMDITCEAAQRTALASFLEGIGYENCDRSAVNIQLLGAHLPSETLHRLILLARQTPSPDLALNSLERLATVIPLEDLHALGHHKQRFTRFMVLCGASPFLVNLLYKEPSCFRRLFLDGALDISRSQDEMLEALRCGISPDTDLPTLMKRLRTFKRAEILRIAARDLNGMAPLEEVTAELSSLAAVSLQVAYDICRGILIREFGTPLAETENGPREAEMTIIAMGKFGGWELNFSSDIDIIYFYDHDRGETCGKSPGEGRKGAIPLHAFFNKLAEMVNKALAQVTEDGFVFRVDVGLRPEGKSGDMAVSFRSAEIYYESWGRSWERTAMLKARPVAGSLELGAQLLTMLEPFVYRKYLDYNLIEDMKNMKLKIDASLTRSREGETNLKLGRGGIREIEFFIQALQLVYAGKSPALRCRNSLLALDTLLTARLISEDHHRKLSEAYRFLRTVEHRIQVFQERQTHNLPLKEDERLALARRSGFMRPGGQTRFFETLEQHRTNVSDVYGNLFLSRDEKLQQDVHPQAYFLLDPRAPADLVKDMLAERRFEDVDRAYDNLMVLRDGAEKSNLTERSRRILEKITPALVNELFDSPDPDMALTNLERFLVVIGNRSFYFALLAENRATLKLIVSLFGMSEFLSKILISHPELLDSLVGKDGTTSAKDRSTLEQDLTTLLEQSDYVEDRLDALRRYRNEEFLRIGLNDIHGVFGQGEIADQLTLLGETCLATAYRMGIEELQRFGDPCYTDNGKTRTASLAIIGMGKLGGRELNYHSDLDIIFVYDHQGTTNGTKQISNHEYFAKLAQKIIAILTMQTREGYVYKLDTRLRPSGNAGPLVTSLDSFLEYHQKDAQIWERQALTKARVVLGDESLAHQLEEVIRKTVYGRSLDQNGQLEINRLRMRMETEIAKEKEGAYNIKTGRGGMVDVEFATQYLQLKYGCVHPELQTTSTIRALKAAQAMDLLSAQDLHTLLTGYKFLRRLENRLRIIHDYSVNDLSGSKSYLNKLARRLGYDPTLKHPGARLICDYEEITTNIRTVYQQIFLDESSTNTEQLDLFSLT